MNDKYSKWMFIVFPAVTMMLGWGLRGYIGGGPFGAMIPGAMVAISIAMLLKLPMERAAVFAVFGVVAIGLGGEMTYGQTLGFLRNPDTVWWGTMGTTVKGAVWGLLGGIVLAIGLLYNKLSKRTLIICLLLLLAGMLIGFKLINQPMIIYFSDPANPRPESWGALLTGAIIILIFLKIEIDSPGFKIVSRFALWGLIGGGFGFGLGGFWMVLGSNLPKEVIFQNWWKAMEFTFGLLFGASLGYAAWLSRNQIDIEKANLVKLFSSKYLLIKELAVTLVLGLLIYWLLPFLLDPVVDSGKGITGFSMVDFTDIAKMFSNYAFFGLIMILAIIRFPIVTWQIAITLTFCHASLDLIRDFYPDVSGNSLFTAPFALIFGMTAIVALLTAYFQRQKNTVLTMFLLLVVSTIVVAFLRLALHPEIFNLSGLSFCEFVCGRFFVHLVFLSSALFVSFISIKRIKKINQ